MEKKREISLIHDLDVPQPVLRAWKRAKSRAQKINLPCLEKHELHILWRRCEGRCAVSGLPFSEEVFPHAFVKYPFAPSIDRIDSSKDYSSDNTRITCEIANFAMGQWGLEALRRLAHGVIRIEREQNSRYADWYRRQEKKLRNAERLLRSLTGREAVVQTHVIAGLKAAIKKGPIVVSDAAIIANTTIRRARAKVAAAAG